MCIEGNTNNNNNSGAEVAAATRIQATYRGYATRKAIKADSDNVFVSDNTGASNAPSEQAKGDTTGPEEQANGDTTAPEEVSQSAAEASEDEDDNNSPPIVITSAPPDENTPPLQSALVKHNTPTKTGRKVTIDDEAQVLGDSSEDPPSRDQETTSDSEAVPTEETIVTEEANDATKDTEQTKDKAEPIKGENASQSTDTVAQGDDCETKTNEKDSAVESQEVT